MDALAPAPPVLPAPPPDRRLWIAVRQALIIVLLAVEEYIGVPAAKSALIARRLKT